MTTQRSTSSIQKRSEDETEYPVTCEVSYNSGSNSVILELALQTGEPHGQLEVPLDFAKHLAKKIETVAGEATDGKESSSK